MSVILVFNILFLTFQMLAVMMIEGTKCLIYHQKGEEGHPHSMIVGEDK